MIWEDGQWVEESEYNEEGFGYLGKDYLKYKVDADMSDIDICLFVSEYCAEMFD
jgi:hypothetical protein